MKTENMKKTHF